MLALLIMHGSILLVTMRPRAHPWGLQFFSFLEVYSPSTGTPREKEAITHPIDLIYVFCNIFLIRTKAKRHVFTTFMYLFQGLLTVR